MVGVVAVGISVIVGLILGAIAAYWGGWWDSIVMRTADVFFAFPYVLFAITLIAVLGQGVQNVFIAIGILGWPSIARVFRSSILSIKENEYVDAARSMGASNRRIIFRHIMPNSIAPIIVLAHHEHRGRHPDRGGSELPGHGRPAAGAVLGQHALRGPLVPVHRALADAVSRARDPDHGAWLRPAWATVSGTPST